MKKILSLFTAILFAGILMADEFHLEKVTSVAAGKTYAFVRNNKALGLVNSKNQCEAEDLNLGTLTKQENYCWKLVDAGGGLFKINNLAKGENHCLRNGSGGLAFSDSTKYNDHNKWKIEFTGEEALISIPEDNKFIAEMNDNPGLYKVYSFGKENKGLEDYPGHNFTVYELKAGASVNPSLLADDKLDLKSVMSRSLPYNADTNIVVTASNLTADITTAVKGSNVSVPKTLAKEGGKLNIHIYTDKEGQISDTIVLTSGALKKEVVIEINVVKSVGEGSEENPFTLEDVAKFNNGYAGKHWVKGFIVGYFKKGGLIEDDAEKIDSTRLALGTTKDQKDKLIPVSLSKTTKGEQKVREELNIKANPDVIGYEVLLYGKLEGYQDTTGIKSVSDYKWVGEAPQSKKSKDASLKWLKIEEKEITAKDNVYAFVVVTQEANYAQVTVTFELNDTKAKADKESGFKIDVPATPADPAAEVKLTVTAEDGVTKAEYIIKVSRVDKEEPDQPGEEALDQIENDTCENVKTFVNGQLIIIKNGVKYNAQGAMIQ